MSDEEIRNLLDLGVEDLEFGRPIEATDTWASGRRIRTRRSWGVGLGAVAAAAAVVGVVWTQGLGGGDVAPPPPQPADGTLTGPVPTLTGTGAEARGEPFFAQFEKTGIEAPFQLSGSSEPATLDDLQGTWVGPDGAEFTFDDDHLTATINSCSIQRGVVELDAAGRLTLTSDWAVTLADGPDCPTEQPAVPWTNALGASPMLSLDGETLLISGFDRSSPQPESRVPASLTLGAIDEAGFIWEDRPSQTGVTPLELGDDFQLMVSAAAEDMTLTHISELNLESPGLCGQVMASSLRSDGMLLAGAPAPWPVCTEGEEALPPAEPSPAVVALLRSGPTVSFDDGTMTISGTVPEALLDQSAPSPDNGTATSEPPQEGSEAPPVSGDLPESSGPTVLVVMSEGSWEPTGELTALTDSLAVDRRWLPVTTDSEPPEVGRDGFGGRGLSFDGTTWQIRDCGIDISMDGAIENGRLLARGEPEVVPDPDPGAACAVPLTAEDWVSILTGEPLLSTDGEILVIEGTVEDASQVPVGMALLPDGVSDPAVGPVSTVTAEDLAAGLTEVPGAEASQEIGVSDARDPQPEHATTLTMEDGFVTVDVGCSEPLRGPAWFSYAGPEEVNWQLTAALPEDVGCEDAAANDAEMWRQMLAHGAFVHHFGDYVIVDSLAHPE